MTREEAFNKKALMLSTQLNFDIVLNEIYDDFEQQLKEAKDLRNNSVLISQEDVDFLQLQNQQYADTVAELEQQLSNIKHNLEAQEIMLADKDMWIRGLEAELKRLKDKQ